MKTMKMTLVFLGLVGLMGAVSACSKQPEQDGNAAPSGSAQRPLAAPPGSGGPPGMGQPPPESFEACVDKAEGDECTMKHGDREMKGTCATAPPNASDTRLSCSPSGHPGGGPRHKQPKPAE